MRKLFLLVLVVWCVSPVFGSRFYGTQDSLWTNSANWDAVPTGSGDSVNIKADCLLPAGVNATVGYSHASYNNNITFDVMGNLTVAAGDFSMVSVSGITATVNIGGSLSITDPTWGVGSAFIGNAAGSVGIMNVNGGSLTPSSNAHLYVGYLGSGSLAVSNNGTINSKTLEVASQVGSSGQFSMSSGTVTLTSNASIGIRGAATASISGGTLNANILYVGNSSLGGTGSLSLTAGALNVAGTNIQNGSIDIENGILTIGRDEETMIGNYLTSGALTGYGSVDNIRYSVDNGITTVWAVPEPATISLLGFAGLLVLRKRK